jgi:hypothetical protein
MKLCLPLALLLLLLPAASWAGPTSLRKQWAKSAGSLLVPTRVIILRSCGTPTDLTQPVGNMVCDTSMQAVSIACLDTRVGYVCDQTLWKAVKN